MKLFNLFFLVTFAFFQDLKAEVLTEKFVMVGNYNKDKISLKEHKVPSGIGYSITKVYFNGVQYSLTISQKRFKSLTEELESILKVSERTTASEFEECDNSIFFCTRIFLQPNEINNICLSKESPGKKKEFAKWWKKASRGL